MPHPLLNSVAATTTHRDRDELDRAVARLLMEFLDTYSITLLRLVADGPIKRLQHRVRMCRDDGELGPTSVSDVENLPALTEFPACHECALRGEVVTSHAAQDRYMTVFPVSGEREIVGVLIIETSVALPSREADLVLGILGILRNHLALLDYGELDTLTGLLNRKTFEGYFDKLHRRRLEATPDALQNPLQVASVPEASWLALIDIDHFKSINDSYGHLFGDEVLLLVSRLMKQSFRATDQLFRFGGEEFIVVLEHATEPGARIAFERLRARIEAYSFPQVGRVTISVGYTRVNPQDIPPLCVERADAALYYAKTHGRNNVRNSEELIASGEISAKVHKGDVELF